MPRKQTKKSSELHDQALQIASEIFELINQYTHDSATSKFFLPEAISSTMYITAGGFTSVVYTPQLELEDIRKAPILSLFLVLTTFGFQIYIKERSLKTNAAPYHLPTDETIIAGVSQTVITQAMEGNAIASPLAEEIITIILNQLENTIDLDQYQHKTNELHTEKVYDYMLVSLYFGYNLAAGLLHAKEKKLSS